MKAVEILDHFRGIGPWVDWNHTVDRIILGDPQTEVKKIAVCWQARTETLHKAVAMGCNLMVVHENIFYRHWDNDEKILKQPQVVAKKKYIEDNGLVILRCHDTWDQVPVVGVIDSWAAQLGLKNRLRLNGFHAVYESPAPTLIDLAQRVAGCTVYLGQDVVQVMGDPKMKITKVGIGCGAITQPDTMVAMGADALIVTDDGIEYLGNGGWAMDKDVGMIVVNHGTAEEPGVRNLATYLGEKFPQVKTVHIPQGCMYVSVPRTS